MKFHSHPLYRRARLLLVALALPLASTALFGQVYGPLQNVRIEPHDQGAVIFYDKPQGYDPLNADPVIWYTYYKRDGGDPMRMGSVPIDAPLDPETTYSYEIYGTDSQGTIVTESATAEVTIPPTASGITTSRLSVTADGLEREFFSIHATISGDGRYVAYSSYDYQGHVNTGRTQILRHDRETGETIIVSKNADGDYADGNCDWSAISADGRFIVFASLAKNLSPEDADVRVDIYFYDAQTDTVTLITDAPGIGSGNGQTSQIHSAPLPAISADGSTVAFIDIATNLHPEAPEERNRIYLYNTLTTELSLVPEPVYTPFNYIDVGPSTVTLSGDGSLVVFSVGYRHNKGFQGNGQVIWQFDRNAGDTGELTPVTRRYGDSNPAAGTSGAATISSDGRYIAFAWSESDATNDKLLDEQADYAKSIDYNDRHKAGFILDRQTDSLEVFTLTPYGRTTGNLLPTSIISISDDGRFVAFYEVNSPFRPYVGYAPDNHGGVFIRDRVLGRTTLASRATNGDFTEQYPGSRPTISGDGSAVVYESRASNLVGGDTNNQTDIFLTGLDLSPPDLVAPTWPDGNTIEATNTGATLVDLAWSEAEDIGGSIAGYRIYGDGETIANTGPTERTLQVPGLDPETTTLFKVEALDGAGNISTGGPQVEVTTKALSSGGASLSAPVLDGGDVQLAWDPAEEAVLGYIVERRDEGGDWNELGEVGPTVTMFLDPGLPAGTTVSYRILKKPTAGDPLVHSATTEITTKALSISSVTTGLPTTVNSRSLLQIGGLVDLRLEAESGRQGRAEVSIEQWVDSDDPAKGTSQTVIPIDLAEGVGTPGLYLAEWTIPAGTARVLSVKGILSDGFGASVSGLADGFPMAIEARFSVSVDGSADDYDRGLVFTLWSETARAGCSRAIAGSASIEKGGLPPGDDYRLRIIQGNRVVRDLAAVALNAGLETTIDESLEPATAARFLLKDPDGEPRGEYLIGIYEADTDRFIGWGEVAPDGTVDAAPGVLFAPGSEITYRLQKEPWDIEDGPLAATIPAFGQTGTLNLEWGPYFVRPGVITGRVVDSEGNPTTAWVMAMSGNEGVQEDTRTSTASDGSFSLDPVYATANVTARGSIRDPDTGRRTKLVGIGQFEVPDTGGSVDVGEIRLEPVLKVEFIIRSLELVQPDGSIRQVSAGSDPLTDHVWLKVIRPGFLRSDARATGTSDGLRLEIEYPVDTDYILTVNAGAIGYGNSEITGKATADDADANGIVRVEIETVELLPASDTWVTAHLLDREGAPIPADTEWTASTIRGGVFGRRSYFGYGPDLQLPTAIGSGQLRLNLTDQPDKVIATPLVAQTGSNDLGDLRFSPSGRFRTSNALSLITEPRLLGPDENVRSYLRIRNLQNTPVVDGRVAISVPDGLEPVEGTAMIDDQQAETIFSDHVLSIETGSLTPADFQRIYVEFQRTEAFDADSISLYATYGYSAPEGQVEEQVGSNPIEVIVRPTITGPAQVEGRTIILKGRAPNGTIRIYDGNELIGTRRVSSQGYWKMEVILAERRVPYWHTITTRVTTSEGEEIVSDPFNLLHQPDATRPSRMRFRQAPVLNEPKSVILLKRFPDVVEWTEVEMGPEVSTAWRRILAGFPFEFELEFNDPEFVRELEVTVAGPGGGTASADNGKDGVFRATVETDRDDWYVGPISIAYLDATEAFPRWGNELEIGAFSELPEESSGLALARSEGTSTTLDYDGRDNYVQGGSFPVTHRDLDATFTYKVWPDVDLADSDTATISYPGGSLTFPAETVPFRKASFDYNVSGRNFRFSTTVYVDYERFLARDRSPPSWGENAAIAVTEPGATSAHLTWPRANDELWIQEYSLTLDGTEIARIPGGLRSHTLNDLTSGLDYEVAIVPIDGADKTGPSLGMILEFKGTETQVSSLPPMAKQEEPALLEAAWDEVLRSTHPMAAAGGGAVGAAIDVVGNAAVPIDILSLAIDYFDAYEQVDRWNDMIDAMDSCGASPTQKDKVEKEIAEAAAALVAKTYIGTGMTVASLGATATGAGAPVGAAIAVTGLVSGYVLGEVEKSAANDAEDAFKEAMDSNDDCDDPDKPRRTKSSRTRTLTLADPVWKIDPSGYVFEVLEDNRLKGVTATLLEGEGESGPWIVSDAEAFGEINPQVTPAGGVYRWDVPAGWWRVMYQKEGYETTFSDALPVPPPHFDVNIPLKSLAAPEVTAVNSLNNGAALEVTFANYIRAAMASPATVRVRTAGGNLVEGEVYAAADQLVDNPHTESEAKDITTKIAFVPAQRLTIGETYTVEVDGVIESYGEIPMGETASIEVSITDDRTGTYFGTFDPGGGLWTARVKEEGRTIAIEGYDPETGTVFAVEGTFDEDGSIRLNMEDLDTSAVLTGTMVDGVLSGTVSVLGYTVAGTRSLGAPAATDGALTYHGAVIGSKSTTVTATRGPDGIVLAVIAGELATAATSATIDEQSHFSGFLSDGSELELDLSDPDGAMTGVLSLVGNGSWEVLGSLAGSPKARLVNVSGRGPVRIGNGNLIAGFVIRGSADNPMLVRAIGPGLENFGLQGVLQKPRIRLVDQSKPVDENLIAENSNWLEAGNRNELRAVFAGLGAFFLDDARSDATVYVPVTPGPYTAVVEGIDGDAGITLVEAYDADLGVFGSTSEGVANLSLRGDVGTGAAVMIAGFVIDGDAPRRVLIRGIGPALAGFGVQGTLTDPAVTLYQGDTPVRDNQSWGDFLPNEGLVPVFEIVGAFALDSGSKDAAIVLWLSPGPYTVHLESEDAAEGIGLIEIYDLP
ncbi:MAG: hypothetical protein DRP71_12955 [Verrucomicrobia bacterium]|nr:MAG: hypothetical protein DRP71_12955 [Verrucomicrobiota bacterium]